jgi:phosphoribosylformylglycinamidine synthase
VVLGLGATDVPSPLDDPLPRYRAVHEAIAGGLVHAAHDCSDGGLAVAVAEMAIAARVGVFVTVPADGLDPLRALTNEAPGRLVLAAAPSDRDALDAVLAGHGRRIGEVMADDRIVLRVPDAPDDAEGLQKAHATILDVPIADAHAAFAGSTR